MLRGKRGAETSCLPCAPRDGARSTRDRPYAALSIAAHSRRAQWQTGVSAGPRFPREHAHRTASGDFRRRQSTWTNPDSRRQRRWRFTTARLVSYPSRIGWPSGVQRCVERTRIFTRWWIDWSWELARFWRIPRSGGIPHHRQRVPRISASASAGIGLACTSARRTRGQFVWTTVFPYGESGPPAHTRLALTVVPWLESARAGTGAVLSSHLSSSWLAQKMRNDPRNVPKTFSGPSSHSSLCRVLWVKNFYGTRRSAQAAGTTLEMGKSHRCSGCETRKRQLFGD